MQRVPRRRRGDPRAAQRRRSHRRVPALDRGAGRPGRHGRVQPRPLAASRSVKLIETVDVKARLELAIEMQRERLAELQVRVQDPRRRRVRRPGAAARVLPAQADGVDPQGAGRGRGRPDQRVRDEDRRGRDARGGRRAGRARASAARAPGRAVARVLDDPQLPRLAAGGAVVEALRGAARPEAHPRGPRRGPRRPRGREAAHHRVHRGSEAAPGARHRGRQPRQRRDPHPGRASRHRQDLDRRVRRPLTGARVRAPVPGRYPRRGRDPRSPPHLHRRAAGPDRPRPARREDDEPGDPARRGRQGRSGLARRSLAALLEVLDPLRTTPSATTTSTSRSTSPRSSSWPPPTSSTRSRRPCSTAWR